jgi:hypothetical protein
MTDHNHDRLDLAISRRDKATKAVQRLQGRLQAAEEDVAKVEAECAERGVHPDKLDAAITQLEERFGKAMTVFEQDITEAEGKLAPFVQEDSP